MSEMLSAPPSKIIWECRKVVRMKLYDAYVDKKIGNCLYAAEICAIQTIFNSQISRNLEIMIL